ncbi:MAG: hypothetical protein ACRDJH_20005 [Thermomicrobiales bacterium]
MAMTNDEILREAARLRAARRLRTVKQCEVCGASFEGIRQRRYCSDRCRVAASRLRQRIQEGEMTDDLAERVRKRTDEIMASVDRWSEAEGEERLPDGQLSEEATAARERARQTVEDFVTLGERISRGRVFDDSTELLRREREARSRHLASL